MLIDRLKVSVCSKLNFGSTLLDLQKHVFFVFFDKVPPLHYTNFKFDAKNCAKTSFFVVDIYTII